MLPLLDERQRRLYLANEAKAIGYGGISQVSRVSGISRVTITLGMAEISSEGYQPQAQARLRRKGGAVDRVDRGEGAQVGKEDGALDHALKTKLTDQEKQNLQAYMESNFPDHIRTQSGTEGFSG